MPVLIQLPVDIPDVEVLATEFRPDGALLIKVKSTRQGACCSRCGRETHHFQGYDRPIQLRHLPLLERQVYLELRPKRYRCPSCEGRPTTTQRCDWYEPNRPPRGSPNTHAISRHLGKMALTRSLDRYSFLRISVGKHLFSDTPHIVVGI